MTTDHFRGKGGSAVKQGLCGHFLICKLGIGKTLKLEMQMRYD